MKSILRTAPFLLLLLLPACFMSAEPRIKTGTLIEAGPVAFCSPDEDECETGLVDGDGYRLASDSADEEDLLLRLEPLVEAGGTQIYLAEAELRDEDGAAWAYLVARVDGLTPEGLPRISVMMPGCNDFGAALAAGPGFERGDSYTCQVSDLAAFRQYLIDNYSGKFADDGWWADEN